jgi:Tfp pilus assembly protein PilX
MKRQKEMLKEKNRKERSGCGSGDRSFGERVNNEDGFVLILSMMVLVVLTLLGMSGTRSAIIETQIAGNDNMAKILFYDAESAAHEAAQRLKNEKDRDALKADRPSEDKLVVDKSLEPILLTDVQAQLADQLEAWEQRGQVSVLGGQNIGTEMAALDYGVVKGGLGSSLKITDSKVYFFKILGRAVLAESGDLRDKMIEIGYKKRY